MTEAHPRVRLADAAQLGRTSSVSSSHPSSAARRQRRPPRRRSPSSPSSSMQPQLARSTSTAVRLVDAAPTREIYLNLRLVGYVHGRRSVFSTPSPEVHRNQPHQPEGATVVVIVQEQPYCNMMQVFAL